MKRPRVVARRLGTVSFWADALSAKVVVELDLGAVFKTTADAWRRMKPSKREELRKKLEPLGSELSKFLDVFAGVTAEEAWDWAQTVAKKSEKPDGKDARRRAR